VLRHPELAPVLSRAMSAVIDALELGEETPPDVIAALEDAAATAMTEAYEPIAVAASRLSGSTETSRETEAASVRRKAAQTAALVVETATALQQRHDRLAEQATKETATAARLAAAASVPGFKAEAKKRAVQKAAAVQEAAAARDDRRAAAAALTAAAADGAAVRLALEAKNAAADVKRDAAHAAATVQAITFDVMYEIAIDAACRRYAASSGPEPP